MYTLVNTVFGIGFVVIAGILTFLMFNIWKYPFDHENLRSSAPAWMIRSHRLLGLVYVLIYIYLMWQMVPRLWDYQIELPARTVMHLTLGMGIGAILVTKITIVRFFKHMEAKLVPALGTALFIASLMLIFLALPFSFREIYLSESVLDGESMTNERIERVKQQLPKAGIDDPDQIERLASAESLEFGRRILTSKCVQCHDLRTVLARPRTPMAWKQTVSRMANRSTVLNPITEDDQLAVTAYLIAVSPTLQETLKQRRELQMESVESQNAMMQAKDTMKTGTQEFDLDKAKSTFETVCSLCHSPQQVENAPPKTTDEAIALVQRMVGNGLTASQEDLDQVIFYLTKTYAKQTAEEDSSQESEQQDMPSSQETSAMNLATMDGASLYQQRACIACHGAQGRSPIGDNIPKLAGQNKEYLVNQLKDLKSRARRNGFSGQMLSVIPNVTEEEMVAIATYLSQQPR